MKKEERYIVVKLKHLSLPIEENLRDLLYEADVPTIGCVVIEEEWPEYEPVWSMLETRVDREKLLHDVLHCLDEGYGVQANSPIHREIRRVLGGS